MQTTAPTPVEVLRWIISRVAVWMTTLNMNGTLPYTINLPLMARLTRLKDLLARITELVQSGRYVPRRYSGERTSPCVRRPRQPGPLPCEFGWLTTLMPQAQQARASLLIMLEQPETIALIQAAPIPLIRPLRSLCWALRLAPPPVLARARRAAPPAPVPPAAAAPEPLPPAPPSGRPSPRPRRSPARAARASVPPSIPRPP
jgi:hypothetical protein